MRAIKLDSTPFPVFAEASKIEIPVLLENSIISSSLTCLYGKLSSSVAFAPFALIYSTISYLFAITIIGMLGAACWSTSFIQLSKFKKDYLSKRSKQRTIPSAPL